MKESEYNYMRDYLDGRISAPDLAELNALLEGDADARARFRALATMEEGLRDLAEVSGMEGSVPVDLTIQPSLVDQPTLSDRKTPIVSGFFYRPVVAAVAGLMLGVFCTSVMWAASESGRRKILTLIHESFESGVAPSVTGIPSKPDEWNGDYTKVVSEENGVLPVHGEQMLRFLRADHEGKENPVGYVGDLYRVVDLRSYESTLMNDDAVVSVEAGFRSIPFQEPNRYQCGISVYALREVPANKEDWKRLFEAQGKLMEDSLATAQRWIFLDGEESAWQKARTEMRVPVEARYLAIGIRVSDRSAIDPAGEEPPAVEFSGQFVDDVRVVLSRPPSNQ